ncbi:hypothetical protein [Roseinatronobacter alkalisoli]|uniref:Major facilitator superfamily (MFS) profile domain-containing protein n=1 Tax=Roseinatronobacter alkalisoli TaxID=3028235 RepID=A0ABT5T8F7_9RHOB|nr:hypothetical protein [Roseinatronobacter sp. HJB301]MDD7971407.1 hypothetical protein [Roseinatronobacter sp. HJB301]
MFILRSLMDLSGQIITVLGFMMLLGGLVSGIWIGALVGVVMMIVGFFLLRSMDER